MTTERKTYRTFDEYVADYPDAERYRAWLTGVAPPTRRIHRKARKPAPTPRPVTVVPCEPEAPCQLPGGYFWVRASGYQGRWVVSVNDCDDGLMQKWVDTEAAALAEVENLIALAPFTLPDLRAFGYEY